MNQTISKTLMLAATAALALCLNVNAATFVVGTTTDVLGPANSGLCSNVSLATCSLRQAISDANALAGADDITLPAGTYTQTLSGPGENANVTGDFDITQPLTINGAGSATTIIEANAAPNTGDDRVMHLISGAGAVTINDVTMRHGNPLTAVSGGGFRVEGATTVATLNRVLVTLNRALSAGGGIQVFTAGATLNVNASTISNNFSGGSITGSAGQGGGLNATANANPLFSTINLTNTMITGNTSNNSVAASSSTAGGLAVIATNTMTNCTVSNNTATSAVGNTFGGGMYVAGGITNATGCTFNGNTSTVTGGTGSGLAGGIYVQSNGAITATLNLDNSCVTGNSAAFHGGIRSLASAGATTTTNITNSTISGNMASGNAVNGGEGGGVVNFATGAFAGVTNVTGSTISGNTAATIAGATGSVGGGIENVNTSTAAATVNLLNSTVSGNSAALAGGTYNDGSVATVNFDYSTVAANMATTDGGGVYQDTTVGGVTNLKDSIVADNTAGGVGPDIFGTITSQGYNHVENTTGGLFVTTAGDVTGTDPLLGALANNGGASGPCGPRFTHHPLPGSPVLNTITSGTNGCGTTVLVDERGFTRPVGAGCEKGSVEVQLPTFVSAVSRKTHGTSGTFDINLPPTSPFGVEDRVGGAGGAFLIVFTFNNSLSPTPAPTALVTAGTGVAGTPVVFGNTVSVPLSGVTDVQLLTLTLSGVTDKFGQAAPTASASIRFLIGDTNGSGSVSATDISQTKAQSGQLATASNFRTDVNMSGSINATDISIVKSKSGNFVP